MLGLAWLGLAWLGFVSFRFVCFDVATSYQKDWIAALDLRYRTNSLNLTCLSIDRSIQKRINTCTTYRSRNITFTTSVSPYNLNKTYRSRPHTEDRTFRRNCNRNQNRNYLTPKTLPLKKRDDLGSHNVITFCQRS